MSRYLAAVDIGATSGRLLLASSPKEEDLKEIHRFKTPLVDDGDGHCHWDVKALFDEIVAGLKKCRELGTVPSRLGIDSFGVDYALLDEDDHLVGEVISYRDRRTDGVTAKFMSKERLFSLTGIQPQNFNSVYQLFLDRESGKLARASSLLFLPCYLAYLLTGTKANELSIVSTSGLFSSAKRTYVPEILSELGLDASFFGATVHSGESLGHLRKELVEEIGYDIEVVSSLNHDTAAAFLGSGAEAGDILISSGTWSLIGVILPEPIVTPDAMAAGFTNELSRPGEVRFLKNVVGMYIVNRLRDELTAGLPFSSVVESARASTYEGNFDPTLDSLLNPENMVDEVTRLLIEGGYPRPEKPGDYFKAAYLSLALAYGKTAFELNEIAHVEPKGICVFGGGSQNLYLNELTSEMTGLPVKKGPSEATGLGTILAIDG